jgi:hypothetical protein
MINEFVAYDFAPSVGSWSRISTDTIKFPSSFPETAAMRTWRAGRYSSQFDPTATLAVHCGNVFDAGFRLYRSTRLSR